MRNPQFKSVTALERFLADAAAAGCPRDQVENFLRAGLILQPKQLAASAAARRCDLPDGPTAVGFGGARGGGKSHWLIAQLGADDCQRVPGLKCLLLRKVGKSNRENFGDLRLRVLNKLPHSFAESRGLLTFANGSRIICGHFQKESDIDAYLGLEYDAIGIEEATTLTARKHQDITTCCRSSKTWTPSPNCAQPPSDSQLSERQSGTDLNSQLIPWRPRIYSTSNPGGVGHAWYKKLFIDSNSPCEVANKLSTHNPQLSTIFIPARVTDNHFTNPGYRKILQNLTDWKRRAWLDGDWDIAAGQFFSNFRREVHVIDDFDDARGVEWIAAMDYGFVHYTVVLLACKDADGRFFIVDEHAHRLWLPQHHAVAIRAMFARHNIHLPPPDAENTQPPPPTPKSGRPLKRFLAGPDVFGRQCDGTTIAQQYSRQGISLRPANNDRINGWAEILSLLGDPDSPQPPGTEPSTINNQPSTTSAPSEAASKLSPLNPHLSTPSNNPQPSTISTPSPTVHIGQSGTDPRLFIHKRCAHLIHCLPTLQHDPLHPDDVLKADPDEEGFGGDDAADCLRYLVATRPPTITVVRLRGM